MIELPASERYVIASAIGFHEQYLYQCLTGRRVTPAERCPAIEMASGGKVVCEQLRPDVAWHRVQDPAWPHPQGRPCIDVARSAGAGSAETTRAAA